MRYGVYFILALFLVSCSQRIPPEVALLREKGHPFVAPKKAVVIVDAGHGGKDLGANSRENHYEEKQLTLETALLLSQYLSQMGYKTVLTRTHDTFVPLTQRAEIANSLEADLFVSIHYNFCPSQEVEGVEVYYYKENKSPHSQRILQSRTLGQCVIQKITTSTGAESRGVKEANFAVVRQTEMPAILIEAGFLSNRRERAKICTADYRKALARGIAAGVDSYLSHRP